MGAVSINNVRKSFGNVEVLHGVSVDVAEGEFAVLVGPSGCGKSTLLRMIAGLEDITSGEISIGDRVVNQLAPKDRDIAMVFQSYALYPHMTVAENMGFSLKLSGVPKPERRKRVEEAAAILGLTDYLDRQPRQLSGRPAPARRHGPRHRPQSGGLFVRRTALQSRRQAPGADALRDQAEPSEAQDDDRLCHPRPDRGHDHGRPHRRHECRPHRTDRLAARTLRHAGKPVRRRLHRFAGHESHSGSAG